MNLAKFLAFLLLFLIKKTNENLIEESKYFFNSKNLIIGSFNIQSLGPTKMGRPEFVETVCNILSKYDIVLIQEIKDSSTGMNVINELVRNLNNIVK